MAFSELPATRTSLLRAIDNDAAEQKLIALGVFYERYRRGLAKVLSRRFRIHPQDADDILHDFLFKKMADASLINSYYECLAKSGHRSFRPYLVRALTYFTLDRLKAKKEMVSLEALPSEGVLGDEFSDLYALGWVEDLLAATFQQLRSHYCDSGRETHWVMFVERWLKPIVLGSKPPSHESLAEKYQLADAKKVGNILTNALRTFKDKWAAVLADDIGSADSRALAEALDDARASLRMAKYMDAQRLLNQAIQFDGTQDLPAIEGRDVDESTYSGLLDLLTDGLDQLFPVEQALIYESYLRTPLRELLPQSSFLAEHEVADVNIHGILLSPEPNSALLRAICRDLRNAIRTNRLELPTQVAGTARLVLIALADARCDDSITSASPTQLSAAMKQVLDCCWLDESSRDLLQGYIQRHDGKATESQ